MPATTQYDVVLDGNGYLIDPETYRGRVKNEFAPKTRTGDAGYGDLAGSSAWAQSDWRGGFGYEEWDPEHPTRFADGTAIDISYGDLRPGRAMTLVPSSPAINSPLVIHKGVLYAVEYGGAVYRTNDGLTWVNTSAPFALQSLWVHGGVLFGGAVGSGTAAAWNGASWTAGITPVPGATGVTAGFQSNYPYPLISLAAVAGAYGALPGTTAAPGEISLYSANVETGGGAGFVSYNATLPYTTIDPLAFVTNGNETYIGTRTTSAYGTTGALYIAVGTNWTTDLRLIQRLHDTAISSFQVYKGQLYAASWTKGIIWKVTDNGLEVIFQVPEVARGGAPPSYAVPIMQMTVDNERLYVPITDVQGVCIYQFDGEGWCRFTPAFGGTSSTAVVAFGGALLLATTVGVYRAPPGYAASATLITSWFDAALGTVDKLPLRFTITHTPLIAGQSITIEYALDDSASWINLGTSNTVGAAQMEVEFPGDVATGTRIRFRYTMTGSTSANAIKVRTVVFEYQLVPDPKREWLFAALCAGVPGKELIRIDGTEEPRTGGEIADNLWATRGKKELLAYTDIDGSAYQVTFEALEEEVDRGRPRAELATRANVRLTEA